jgi:hypothetical protein
MSKKKARKPSEWCIKDSVGLKQIMTKHPSLSSSQIAKESGWCGYGFTRNKIAIEMGKVSLISMDDLKAQMAPSQIIEPKNTPNENSRKRSFPGEKKHSPNKRKKITTPLKFESPTVQDVELEKALNMAKSNPFMDVHDSTNGTSWILMKYESMASLKLLVDRVTKTAVIEETFIHAYVQDGKPILRTKKAHWLIQLKDTHNLNKISIINESKFYRVRIEKWTKRWIIKEIKNNKIEGKKTDIYKISNQ